MNSVIIHRNATCYHLKTIGDRKNLATDSIQFSAEIYARISGNFLCDENLLYQWLLYYILLKWQRVIILLWKFDGKTSTYIQCFPANLITSVASSIVFGRRSSLIYIKPNGSGSQLTIEIIPSADCADELMFQFRKRWLTVCFIELSFLWHLCTVNRNSFWKERFFLC